MAQGQQVVVSQFSRDSSPVIHVGPVNDGIKQMFDSLARRAFEIFESHGHAWGNDLSDWHRAERELFHSAHTEISESDTAFSIRAELPGFASKDLEINIDGRQLTISGKREKHQERKDKKTIYSESCSDQVLRVLDLPADVYANRSTATLKDGILQLDIPKTPAKKITAAPPAA